MEQQDRGGEAPHPTRIRVHSTRHLHTYEQIPEHIGERSRRYLHTYDEQGIFIICNLREDELSTVTGVLANLYTLDDNLHTLLANLRALRHF